MSAEPDDFVIERRAEPRSVPLNREARFSRILLVLIPLTVIGVVGGLRLLVDSRTAKITIAGTIARAIARRTDSGVRLADISFGWAYQPCLQGLTIGRETGSLGAAIKAKEACVDRWASAIGSGFRAVKIKLVEPAITLEGLADGAAVGSLVDIRPTDTATDATSAPGRSGTRTGTTGRGRSGAPRTAPLQELTLEFDDLTLDWRDLPLPERVASGSFGPIDGVVTVQRRGPRSAITLSLREPRTGLTFKGRATPTDEGWDLALIVEGDVGPTLAPLFASAGLDVRRLPVNGEIGIIYSARQRKLTFDIDLTQQDVDIASQLVSARRLTGFAARERLVLEIDLEARTVKTRDALIEVNGVPINVSLNAQVSAGSPAFEAAIAIPTVPMSRLLAAIPGTEPLDELSGLSPAVLFALTFSVSGALRDPDTWQAALEHRLSGIGPDALGSGLEYLRAPSWAYHPLTRDGRSPRALMMGPANPRWASWSTIPYPMRRAVQVSEDANFFLHEGLDIEEIRNAIVTAVTKNERARGGSTLTQQLIKNLFLTRDRTALRKLQEMLLTFLMEAALTKEQIFETYLNVIEWGPNLYGLKEASQHYFLKTPSQLTPREMAYLASVIPGPVLYHAHYEQGYVPGKHQAKVELTLDKLVKLGTLTPEQVPPLDTDPIRFRKQRGEGKAPAAAPAPPEPAVP